MLLPQSHIERVQSGPQRGDDEHTDITGAILEQQSQG